MSRGISLEELLKVMFVERSIKIVAFIFYLIIHNGCMGVAYEKKLEDGYFLSALDTKEDMEIIMVDSSGYFFRVVSSTIFSAGHDENFIIAKQHPKEFGNSLNKNLTSYYIIPLKRNLHSSASKNVIGPLSLEEFEKMKNELGVNVDFSITFKDLE